MEKLRRKENEIHDLDKRNTDLRDRYRRLMRSVQQDIDDLPQEEKDMVMEYRQLPSLEALDLECQAVAARLEMMAEGNSGVIRAFEKRKEDIKRTQEKLEDHNANLEGIKTNITEIREHWEPQLDALIAKISDAFAHNFEQIGCAGEVEVYKDDEDFDRWSIQISVRFRYGRRNPASCEPLLISSTEKAKRCRSSTLTASLVASALSRPFSTSWLCKTSHNPHSVLSTKSIKVWTRATSAWCTSVWSILRAKSIQASISW